ncbi:DUF4347 domain-containing protein [Aquabacter sp. CN5-332]|uniref:DUF4347 domain-containing protein n=1 Tax=Aquabacter sp. CN5-332 TaxID=3156608 RepID=UPI0032B3FE79
MRKTISLHRQIYFVDKTLHDLSIILESIPNSAEFQLLDPQIDCLDQMIVALRERNGVPALHLICHGRPGALVFGSTQIDAQTLAERAADFARIGTSLAPGGDLLLYGCSVAEGEIGLAFISQLSAVTGADVAASRTLTGSEALGGNWDLEIHVGAIAIAPIHVANYPAVLTAPLISGLRPIVTTDGIGPQNIGTGVSFSGGQGYAGGSIRFDVGNSTANDQFVLNSAADPNAAGAISVDAGIVYLGSGTGRNPIGVVDAVENGLNGAALKINFTADSTGAFANPGFESGLSGWNVVEDRVILGTTIINGIVTPGDPTSPSNAGGDADPVISMIYDSELATNQHSEGSTSLRLFNSGTADARFDVVHGPYAYSDTFSASAGDVFHFDWRAAAGDDAYDAFGYLMNADTGASIIVLNETGADANGTTPWATSSVTVPENGNWFFVFVGGTYDYTGGQAVGGSLYVDNFRVERSLVTDAVLTALAAQVSYQSLADDTSAPRSLTMDVTDGASNTSSASTDLISNHSPITSDDTFSATQGTRALVIDVLANDTDADGNTLRITHINGHVIAPGAQVVLERGTVSLDADGKLVFTPVITFDGSVSFTYTAEDGIGGTSTGTVTGEVTPIPNHAPITGNDTFSATQDTRALVIDVLANDTDADGNTLRITHIDGRVVAPGTTVVLDSGTVSLDADGKLVFTPFITFDGSVSFTYTAADGGGGTRTGTVTGEVTSHSSWVSVGADVNTVLDKLGIPAPDNLNELIYIASVIAPGAFKDITPDNASSFLGYQVAAGYDLIPSTVTPSEDLLLRAIATLSLTLNASTAPVLAASTDGSWESSADQNLLFQTSLAENGEVNVSYGAGSAQFDGVASAGWSKAFALQSLRADFSSDLVIQFDRQSQGALHQATILDGAKLAVSIGGAQAGTPQAMLSNNHGFVDFITADEHSAVAITRPVAVANTVNDADDQHAVVRMRQNGQNGVEVLFYKVDDFSGTIDGIKPGDAGYEAASLARAYHAESGGTWVSGAGYGKYGEEQIVGVDNGDIIAMRLHTSEGNDFYAFSDANKDGNAAHLWGYGFNTWGWEDLAGGGDRDFNDLVVQIDFVSAQINDLLG